MAIINAKILKLFVKFSTIRPKKKRKKKMIIEDNIRTKKEKNIFIKERQKTFFTLFQINCNEKSFVSPLMYESKKAKLTVNKIECPIQKLRNIINTIVVWVLIKISFEKAFGVKLL